MTYKTDSMESEAKLKTCTECWAWAVAEINTLMKPYNEANDEDVKRRILPGISKKFTEILIQIRKVLEKNRNQKPEGWDKLNVEYDALCMTEIQINLKVKSNKLNKNKI
jgi:hypothetical protein